MELLCGKSSAQIDGPTLRQRVAGYRTVMIDLGTGDGRYVRSVARACPDRFAIGIDACREPLRAISRTAPPNALFLIANALALPPDLADLASQVTIICPWGSLLTGLVAGDPGLFNGLYRLSRPGAALTIILNASALATIDLDLPPAGQQVQQAMIAHGIPVIAPQTINALALRAWPSTWARRLASDRSTSAVLINAIMSAGAAVAPRLPSALSIGGV